MQRLLYNTSRPGYPGDYLVSRIHGRIRIRVPGVRDASVGSSAFQADDSQIWGVASEERQWLYQQMEVELRRTLAPMLVYFELNGFILGLRNLGSNNRTERGSAFEKSILEEGLQKIVEAAVTPEEVLSKLERYLGSSVLSLKGLAAAYQQGGLQKCEEMFRSRFLEQVLLFCDHTVVANFFRTVIDVRNIMTLSKALRWNMINIQPLIGGGNMRLLKSDRIASESGLRKMVRRTTGLEQLTSAELHPAQLEPVLYGSLSKTMTRQMRSFGPVQCCSGYIYHCFMTSRKRSQDFHSSLFEENFPEGGEVMQ